MFQEAAKKMLEYFVESFKKSSLDRQYKSCQDHYNHHSDTELTESFIKVYQKNRDRFINSFNNKSLDEQYFICKGSTKSNYSHLSNCLLNIYLNNKNRFIVKFQLCSQYIPIEK